MRIACARVAITVFGAERCVGVGSVIEWCPSRDVARIVWLDAHRRNRNGDHVAAVRGARPDRRHPARARGRALRRPPPDVVPDLDELRRQDAFREANELRAWIEVDDDEIVDYGQTGRSLIGDGPELEAQQVSFPAVEFPVIQPEPELGDGWVRFTQTVGGRIGWPAPTPVAGRPYFHVGAVSAWTTLELLMRANGTTETRLVAASPFPRHSLYDADGVLIDVFGAVEFELGEGTPWGDERTPAFATAVESELERRLATAILHEGAMLVRRRVARGETLVEQGKPGATCS